MKSGIGIGCFWFELETDKPHETFQNLNADDFVSKIKAALETVDNVSAVETIGKPRIIGFNRSSEDEEGNYLPIFSNLSIQFKLHLPFRVQKQYSNGYGRAEVTENFIVLIRYNADIPVTYIYQQDLQDGVNDTTSPVMFIREYLKDKLENSPHCKFSALGPSPFHADIFLDIQINSLAELIETNLVISSRGYDTIDIKLTTNQTETALDIFVGKYQDILESYYNLVILRNHSLRNGIYIFNSAKEILDLNKLNKSIFYQACKNKKLVDETYEKILDDKLNRIEIEREIADKTRSGVFTKENIFYSFVEKLIQDISEIPINEVREILSITESRRQKMLGNISTLLAGIMGGLIGAIIGSLLTVALTNPRTGLETKPTINAEQAFVNEDE